jgi:hypothetical protein
MKRKLSILVVAFLIGCSASAPPPPATYKARGKIVDSKGAAVKHVVVNLEPVNPSAALAQGVADEHGSFVLRTFQPEDGAMPGKYKVWLQPSPTVPIKNTSPVPQKYRSVEESDVTVVIESGDNDLNIKLRD